MLERNKKPLYYCRRLTFTDAGYDESNETFAAPVKRYLNFKSLSGETSLETAGEVNSKNLIAKLPAETDEYTEKSRCYIYAAPPATVDPLCSDADYTIKSVLPINHTVEIVLERTAM